MKMCDKIGLVIVWTSIMIVGCFENTGDATLALQRLDEEANPDAVIEELRAHGFPKIDHFEEYVRGYQSRSRKVRTMCEHFLWQVASCSTALEQRIAMTTGDLRKLKSDIVKARSEWTGIYLDQVSALKELQGRVAVDISMSQKSLHNLNERFVKMFAYASREYEILLLLCQPENVALTVAEKNELQRTLMPMIEELKKLNIELVRIANPLIQKIGYAHLYHLEAGCESEEKLPLCNFKE